MEDKKRTVYVIRSTAVDPDPRVLKAARWISELGYLVRVIGWDREYRSVSEEYMEGIKIERIKIRSKYGAGMKNIFQLILFNIVVLFKLLKEKPDVVHACDLDTVLPAIFLKKFMKRKLVYDIFDFYADSRRVGYLDSGFRWLENWVIRQSDLVIIAHEERVNQLGYLPDHIKEKIITIYNTPEINKEYEEEDNKDVLPYFAYVGVLTPDRGLSFVIKAMDSIHDTELRVAGFGPLEEELQKAVEVSHNISFLGRISYNDALLIQGKALAIIALYDPSIPNNKYAAPNKLYEAAMLGKPIITSAGTLMDSIIEKERIGYVVPYGDTEELKKVFMKIINEPLQSKEMGQRGKRLYEQVYSASSMKIRLQQRYIQLYYVSGA